MKKILGLIAISLLLVLGASAQTTIRLDQSTVKYGATADTINNGETVSDSYYIKDFAKQVDSYWLLDSLSGTPSIIALLEYSYDNVEWYEADRDTLTFVVDGDTTIVQTYNSRLMPYVKTSITAIGGAQNVRYKNVLTIETN